MISHNFYMIFIISRNFSWFLMIFAMTLMVEIIFKKHIWRKVEYNLFDHAHLLDCSCLLPSIIVVGVLRFRRLIIRPLQHLKLRRHTTSDLCWYDNSDDSWFTLKTSRHRISILSVQGEVPLNASEVSLSYPRIPSTNFRYHLYINISRRYWLSWFFFHISWLLGSSHTISFPFIQPL